MAENSLCTTQQNWVEVPPPGLAGYGLNVATIPVDSSVTPILETPDGGGWAFTQDAAGGGWVTYQGGYYHDRSSYLWIGRTSAAAGECRLVNENVWIQNSLVFSGGQVATIEPVVYRVVPSTTTFVAGEAIHFDLTVDGLSVANTQWTFRPESGFPTVVTQCAGQPTCSVVPPGTGFMEVTGVEAITGDNITTFTASLMMQAPCPPAQDSLLDSASVRRGLFSAFDSTLADPGRVERGGMIVRDRMTGTYIVSAFPQVSQGQAATDCSFPLGTPTNLDTTAYDLVAYYHTHGRLPPASFTSCPRGSGLGSSAARGPSACNPMVLADFCDFKVVNNLRKPMYIIDKDNVYIIVPGMKRQIQGRGLHMWKYNKGAQCVTSRVY